jgi:hypothetical protein
MPLIRIKVHQRHKLQGKIIKHGSKLFTPIAYGSMGNLNVIGNPKNQGNIPERILSKIEHGKSRNDDMNRISHTLEIIFTSKLRNGSR